MKVITPLKAFSFPLLPIQRIILGMLTAVAITTKDIVPRCESLSISSLTPRTTPEQIVSAQLIALQKDDMKGVFDFASPSNKANVNNDLSIFDQMVRNGPYYKYLIGHEESAVLLTTTMTPSSINNNDDDMWQGLVRIVPATTAKGGTEKDLDKDDLSLLMSDNQQSRDEPTKEYWWTLSRCKSGLYKDCFMVDAVMPNN